MAKRFPSLDSKSYELAVHFLPNASEDLLNHFAGCIQEAAEEWLDEHEVSIIRDQLNMYRGEPEGWDG